MPLSSLSKPHARYKSWALGLFEVLDIHTTMSASFALASNPQTSIQLRSRIASTPPILRLPVELLVMIKNSIVPIGQSPDGALHMDHEFIFHHVALQATCRIFREIYLHDERLWKMAYTLYGWGRPAPDQDWPLEHKSWRELAIFFTGTLSQSAVQCRSGQMIGTFLPCGYDPKS